jgi:transglutaminase superfamily protein
VTAGLVRFFALPPPERSRTVEAALYLLAVRMAFALLPLPRALRLFGIAQGEAGTGRIAAPEAQEVGRAITRAARYVPFRAVCLQQAFAALLMLRRRGLKATVHLGLAREDGSDDLKAHAWTRCGELPVTGVPQARGFVPVAAFAA